MLVGDKKMPFLFSFKHSGAKYTLLIFSYPLPNTRDYRKMSMYVEFICTIRCPTLELNEGASLSPPLTVLLL